MAYEELGVGKGLPPPLEIQAPKLELKPLPKHLRYEFLGQSDTLPITVNADLDCYSKVFFKGIKPLTLECITKNLSFIFLCFMWIVFFVCSMGFYKKA